MIESTFKDKAFEAFAMQEYEKNPNEVFSIEYEGQKYWLKKGRKTSSNWFHRLCYIILNFEILIPVESKSIKQSIEHETNKINLFKNAGIHVPQIKFKNNEFFVMSDVGDSVYRYIKKNHNTKEELYAYLNKTIDLLCEVHNKGFYHGGAQTRNFTFQNEQVYLIDLEDSFCADVNLKILQFRDLCLFLLSLTKINYTDIDYVYILNRYLDTTKNYSFKEKLFLLCSKLYFIVHLSRKKYLVKFLPNDLKSFAKLVEKLYLYFEES